MSDEGALVQLSVVERHIPSSALPLLASMAGWRRTVAAVSLLHGWVPAAVFVIGAVALACAAVRGKWWWRRQLPFALAVGAAVAAAVYWYLRREVGQSGPLPAFVWLTCAVAACVVTPSGWRQDLWWRRAATFTAAVSCALAAALVLNQWAGYVPTVHAAWTALTKGPLPDQIDPATVRAMPRGVMPPHGAVVSVDISADASKFRHRGELVYLPPSWFATAPPPRLPVVMMIGAEINTPADWIRAGAAASTADAFAAAHAGFAPVLVFADSGGAFGIDTECVNGSRGNADDHLTRDIIPYVVSTFDVSPIRANWGVAGFSTGGTCAVGLAVRHPELFRAFVDIAGDLGPNVGTKEETIARLYGGNAAAWAEFDPSTVISQNLYNGLSGWFAVADGSDPTANVDGQDMAAQSLCALGRAHGIDCGVHTQPGGHDWQFAAEAFAAALPWLAATLGASGNPCADGSARPAPITAKTVGGCR